MARTTTRAILATFAVLMLGAGAAAQDMQRPVLKSSAVVTSNIVRVGDLVENAGIIAREPIFRAPDLGYTGTVSADAVANAVRAHALIGLDTAGLTEVTVTRAARSIPSEEIQDAIAKSLSEQYSLGAPADIEVRFDREMRALYVDPSATGALYVGRINFEPRSGRFDATIEIPTSSANRGTFRLAGRAHATVEVVTVLRRIERGTVLKDADIAIERVPRNTSGRDVIHDRMQAIGLAARNVLQAGRPLRSAELTKPEIVQRNQTVTMVYDAPGITLTMRGKALEGGAEGDTISVLNEQSKRTMQGTVVAPGHVAVTALQPRLAANVTPDP